MKKIAIDPENPIKPPSTSYIDELRALDPFATKPFKDARQEAISEQPINPNYFTRQLLDTINYGQREEMSFNLDNQKTEEPQKEGEAYQD